MTTPWHIDGAEVASGTLPALAPAAEITATYRWPWAHALPPDGQEALGEHTVRFTVDPSNTISETYETKNSLEDRTNAISFSMYITPEMYEAYNVPADPRFPYSAEDWLQKQMDGAPRGVAVELGGNLVVADTGNRRVVTVRGALPGRKIWLPLVVRSGRAE